LVTTYLIIFGTTTGSAIVQNEITARELCTYGVCCNKNLPSYKEVRKKRDQKDVYQTIIPN
jgi:hypothetical protein